MGSDEEDEVIYVTPEELAKLKETGQVDDFELVEDEEYEYEDEPLNDITDNKLARSDTKPIATLGHNETIDTQSLLKKTAPTISVNPLSETPAPAQTTHTTTTSTTTLPPPSTTSIPIIPTIPPAPVVEPQLRKHDHYPGPPQPYIHPHPQMGSHQQPPTAAFPPSHGLFQMKPPEFGRPPQHPPHQGQHHMHGPPPPHHHHQGRIPPPGPPPPYRTIPPHQAGPMNGFHHRQSPPASSSVGGSHYNANVGQVAPPPSHFYNPLASSSSSSAIIPPSPIPIAIEAADKRKDTFASSNYDYDDSIELITAGPLLDPNVPRDIIVKSSFNTATGAKPKSLSSHSPSAPASPLSPSSPSSGGLSGLWQGAVEKVSALSNSASSYLQSSGSHHQQLSTSGRALPNHYDKNAHMRQMQAASEQHHQSSSQTRGMRNMHSSVASSSSSNKINSNKNYWGPGI